jgi:tRNA modification GTPase
VLRDEDGAVLDHAIAIFFPGPASATGEDLVELHLHGGPSTVQAVLGRLARQPKLRAADPGEFTRRACENGRMSLAEAEALGLLLQAETEAERKAALRMAEGKITRRLAAWRERLVEASAQVEAAIEFEEDAGVTVDLRPVAAMLGELRAEMAASLAGPSVARLRDGLRVVIAGPVNSGKSTLLNAITGREAAIASPRAGTTRDIVEATVRIGDWPVVLSDTAGLRASLDEVEAIGIERARDAMQAADLILWLGDPGEAPDGEVMTVRSFADVGESATDHAAQFLVSGVTGAGIAALLDGISAVAARTLALGDEVLSERQRHIVALLADELAAIADAEPVLLAEATRRALFQVDRLVGRGSMEDVFDAVFSSFCVGK